MKYDLISFNIDYYNEKRIAKELNNYLHKLKNARVIAMNSLANGWTRFLIEYQA